MIMPNALHGGHPLGRSHPDFTFRKQPQKNRYKEVKRLRTCGGMNNLERAKCWRKQEPHCINLEKTIEHSRYFLKKNTETLVCICLEAMEKYEKNILIKREQLGKVVKKTDKELSEKAKKANEMFFAFYDEVLTPLCDTYSEKSHSKAKICGIDLNRLHRLQSKFNPFQIGCERGVAYLTKETKISLYESINAKKNDQERTRKVSICKKVKLFEEKNSSKKIVHLSEIKRMPW